jgi:hypothetical protein
MFSCLAGSRCARRDQREAAIWLKAIPKAPVNVAGHTPGVLQAPCRGAPRRPQSLRQCRRLMRGRGQVHIKDLHARVTWPGACGPSRVWGSTLGCFGLINVAGHRVRTRCRWEAGFGDAYPVVAQARQIMQISFDPSLKLAAHLPILAYGMDA